MTHATEGRAILLQADALHIPLADGSVPLVFCSPPYLDARTYGIGAQRGCAPWIDWMLNVVAECCRVCRGLVLVNCAGVTRDRRYQPGPEGLLYEWWKRGGQCWRPAYWHRVGIPGSGGKHWLRSDIEHVLAFKSDREWPGWSNNTANGHPPKWAIGGEMSHRLSNGARVNQWGPVGSGRGRRADGSMKPAGSPSHVVTTISKDIGGHNGNNRLPVLANPGNIVKVNVGGGMLGSKLAHENEAPFPQKLAEWFIRGWCKPGEIVLDPFSGSGTTAAAARRLGRVGIGMDLRWSQCELGTRRLAEPEKPAKRAKPRKQVRGQTSLWAEPEAA